MMSREDALTEAFGPVIHSYTDAEAVDDGMLVALTAKDRCTHALFEHLTHSLPSSPPSNWPVELFGYIAADAKQRPALRAQAAVKGLLGRYHMRAEPCGEIAQLWALKTSGGLITGLSDVGVPDYDGFEIWIVKNELGGVTAMFPSDY